MNELITVIVPVYQGEKTIESCILSILGSSYRNIEILVVNDGSTDKTEEIIYKLIYENTFNNIRLIRIAHSGLAHACNVGLLNSKGEFIGFVDADDTIDSHMLEELTMVMHKGSDMAACGLLLCNEKSKPFLRQYKLKKKHCQCPSDALNTVMWEQIVMSVCCDLFRREKIVDKDGNLIISFPEDVASFEDFAFVCKYILHCKGFLDVLPFRYYFYHKHEGSLTSRKLSPKEVRYALQPILQAGEQVNDVNFIAHKLQYAFRFMALWYTEAYRSNRKEFTPYSENWKLCMQELERYADIYMMSNNVSLFRKCAMWIVRKHPKAGRILAKMIGRYVIK